ncbi:hypothetical protein BST95_05460 [Halioglobus japonicus]|uniref:HTH lysR-type domain-containing protein n=1 Tax=Halioglobus japonicus TaxID=930805 RepID=A0AAP8MDW2_9GAMM|nr:LysR family transcriptional regulator [Halioglobus japonicus]AQA17762.1 hypothetical protein BST95_05460 [Halioglobus japonicus]PLW85714.1 hypothetical protein C0029_14015 [Halioglobus japonicus]GHD17117.1 LysR family transcriptional regulator [Halioglobus japonicus]
MRNIRTFDLNLLKVFLAVYETGSISRAAESLHMTQPAVSLALKRLQQSINKTLFVRAPRGMTPTHCAEELFEPLQHALDIVESALENSQAFDAAASNRIFKLAFGRYGELDLLPRILSLLSSAGSSIGIQSVLDQSQTGLELVASGAIDGCFDFVKPELPQVEYAIFGQEALAVIARKGHPRIRGSITKKAYFAERHVVMTFGEERRAILEDFMSTRGGTRNIMTAVHQYLAVPPVVMKSDAIAIVPQRMAQFEGFAPSLQILPVPFHIRPLTIYLMWHSSRSNDLGWQWLRGRILDLD